MAKNVDLSDQMVTSSYLTSEKSDPSHMDDCFQLVSSSVENVKFPLLV